MSHVSRCPSSLQLNPIPNRTLHFVYPPTCCWVHGWRVCVCLYMYTVFYHLSLRRPVNVTYRISNTLPLYCLKGSSDFLLTWRQEAVGRGPVCCKLRSMSREGLPGQLAPLSPEGRFEAVYVAESGVGGQGSRPELGVPLWKGPAHCEEEAMPLRCPWATFLRGAPSVAMIRM